MKQITLRLPEEMIESLETEAGERDESRSERIRDVLESRDKIDTLREELDESRTTIDRLRREKRQLLEVREEHQELVEYVEEERSLQRRREERRRERERANILTRARWLLVGRPTEETTEV